MRVRNRRRTGRTSIVAVTGALAVILAACGGGGGGQDGSGGGDRGGVIVGTTDTVQTVDPAKCYSYYCSNIFQNAGETLYSYEPGATELSPVLAAEMPQISDDGTTYTIPLREGVTFHDGSEMTSEDVKFSLNRSRWIGHPEGAGFLLDGIDSIETPDPQTVVIELSQPDITFGSKLAYTVATILPSDAYPSPDGPLGDNQDPEEFIKEEFVGSGPYEIDDFRENESITLTAYGDYWGEAPQNDQVLVQFFEKSSQLQSALQAGEVDVAFRHLTPEQRQSLQDSDSIKTVEGEGASIRYLVFNTRLEPSDDPDVRRAMAAAVDRERIIENALGGAGEPLHSMVPPVFESNEPAFQEQYADASPSDFVDGTVDVTLWYSRGHYGDTEPALAQTLQRTLEETGSFNVSLQSAEWAQFTSNAYPGESGQYPVFLLGWYPDYLDADDYVYPFYDSEQSFLQMYNNSEMDNLLDQEQSADSPDSQQRMQTLSEIQQLGAQDVPTLPLYVETPYAFAQQNVSGVEETMGASQIFRYYMISKNE